MPGTNSIREALAGKKFAYMVELVASRLTREAKVFETASRLAQVPEVVAASITSYAGGSLGHDPIRIGTAVRARGLTPNIHLTCVGRDRLDLRRALEDLNALGIENVFAISGDYPLQKRESNPGPHQYYDFDSVQLVEAINELRQQGLHVCVLGASYGEPGFLRRRPRRSRRLQSRFVARPQRACPERCAARRRFGQG